MNMNIQAPAIPSSLTTTTTDINGLQTQAIKVADVTNVRTKRVDYKMTTGTTTANPLFRECVIVAYSADVTVDTGSGSGAQPLPANAVMTIGMGEHEKLGGAVSPNLVIAGTTYSILQTWWV